jgi:hypothetical protein
MLPEFFPENYRILKNDNPTEAGAVEAGSTLGCYIDYLGPLSLTSSDLSINGGSF